MNAKILNLIENNARISSEDIATAIGLSVKEVELSKLEVMMITVWRKSTRRPRESVRVPSSIT